MIAEILGALAGSGRGRSKGSAVAAEGVITASRFRSHVKVDPARLDQVERLAELTGIARYRYAPYDLTGLVQCAREAGLAIRLHIRGFEADPAQAVRVAGFEILEEALINVLKHGDGTASVEIRFRPGRLTLIVTNPVTGRRPEARRPRKGLKRMRRTAERVGGSFHVGPYEAGWLVRAEFPIRRTSWVNRGERATDDFYSDLSSGT
jgi:Signal transduction histidine kinase